MVIEISRLNILYFLLQHGTDFFIEIFDSQFKPPIGVTPVFQGHGEKMIQVVGKGNIIVEQSPFIIKNLTFIE